MPRRVLVTTLLTLVVSTLTVLAPTGTEASVTRKISMRPDAVSTSVTRTRVIRLDRPADSVVAYWRGNPRAVVTIALSQDGTQFGAQEDAGRDEIGRERRDGTTYGALRDAAGAVAVRVTTDRPIAQLTVLGLSDGATITKTRTTSLILSLIHI